MIHIDTDKGEVAVETVSGERVTYPLASPEAFGIVSQAWLRCGWDTKYVYSFSWMGRPIIQLPDDILRMQEAIYQIKPDIIVETGIAHGGSLIFYASLCKAMERGRVIGVDIEIRPHNRTAIEGHELFPFITLIEGSSTAPEIAGQVTAHIRENETVLVILDSNHTKQHVLDELNTYAGLVTPGSYIVATDGIMKDLVGAPRSHPDWAENNPYTAAQDFLKDHPEFVLKQPPWPFNESNGLRENVTYWPGAWLRRQA
jgi:cephalosporin hydroxylase